MRILQKCALVAVLLFLGTSVASADSPGEWTSDLDAAWKASQESGQPMLLFITMENCTYCAKMTGHTFADAAVQSELEASFVAASIDVVKHPRVAKQLQVRSYPATFLVSPDTRVLDRIDGYVTPAELRVRLARVSATLRTAAKP